ncbi:MAG TPA: patatin-like phospholipase family protein [Burkholderiaceae bacterium]|nr:patatin-like phospholipase family protein [Burkholderiaceae bacterium]
MSLSLARLTAYRAGLARSEAAPGPGHRIAALIVAALARLRPWAVAGGLALLAGCSTLPRNAPPVALMNETTIPGMPEVRAPAPRLSAAFMADLRLSFTQESAADFPLRDDGIVRYPQLALSGGGANGAFGAGFLNGWTQTGRRPVFKIVTGVSTGALIAPFAFVGPDYDDSLREFYTTTASRHIFRVLSFIPQLLTGESFAETGPLMNLLEQHVDAALLRRVAQAHAAGRRLYIGTANLDAQRFVVWNMGLIASSGRPEALALFRQVMLASASIPVAFPPVMFDVVAGGRHYDEMHVDGGVGANVFYSGGVFAFGEAREGVGRGIGRERIFVIHNGQLLPTPEVTTRSVRSIAMRSFESAMKAALVGDLFRIYSVAVREQARFFWISIPEGVELSGDEVFDPVRMRALYDVGFDIAKAGRPWSTAPPGLGALSEQGKVDTSGDEAH